MRQDAQAALEKARVLLLAKDAAVLRDLMGTFSELVEACGPLGFCRFNETLFNALLVRELARVETRDPELWCDALFAQVSEALVTAEFVGQLRDELNVFIGTDFVPIEDRVAACAALLTTPENPENHGLTYAQLPAVYAIFRAQLVEWLLGSGVEAEQRLAEALERS